MEEKISLDRVADFMGDCNTVNPATYCDISNTVPDKVLFFPDQDKNSVHLYRSNNVAWKELNK